MTVECPKRPVQLGNVERSPKPRADRVLRDPAREMRWPHPGRERQPRYWLELVIHKERRQRSTRRLRIEKWRPAAIRKIWISIRRTVKQDSQLLIVVLMESVKPNLQIVLRKTGTQTDLPARIG